MSKYKTEKYASGKYMIYTDAPYSLRIGHVTGARSSWSAEQGPGDLGRFPTKKAATAAIIAAYECRLAIDPAYRRLSAKGLCDAPGGCEHYRVAREWDKAGRPSDIEACITERANAV